uniref:Putative secreted protein n=1 Tax=Anopheles darlingi TaxID=43151 RepID=A0A2M4DLW5_ANODA
MMPFSMLVVMDTFVSVSDCLTESLHRHDARFDELISVVTATLRHIHTHALTNCHTIFCTHTLSLSGGGDWFNEKGTTMTIHSHAQKRTVGG